MLTSTFLGGSSAQKRKAIKRESEKAAEGLQQVLQLCEHGEEITSDNSTRVLDNAITRLSTLRARLAHYGQLEQVIEQLESVAREKKARNSDRVEEVTTQINKTNIQLDALFEQRDVLDAQLVGAHVLKKENENSDDMGGRQADGGESSDSSRYSDGGDAPSCRVLISDYCEGDWDDSVEDSIADI